MRLLGDDEAVATLPPDAWSEAAAAALADPGARVGGGAAIDGALGVEVELVSIPALPAAGALLAGAGRGAGGRAVAVFDRAGAIAGLAAADALARLASAGATAAAARLLARPDARRVGVLGAGPHAAAQLAALRTVRDVERVRVFDPDGDRRRAFADECGDDVRVAASAQEAVQDADLIVVATTARDPALRDDWVAPGAFVAAVGATRPDQRELDYRLVARAAFVCVDEPLRARERAADLFEPVAEGHLDWLEVHDLGAVLRGEVEGRADDADIVVYKGTGSALAVVALAARGLGL